MDEAFSETTALTIKGDRLVHIGGEAGVEVYISLDTRAVDLGGETVIPSLVEEHMHVAGLNSSLMNLDCFWMPEQTTPDLVRVTAEQAKPGEWTQSRGWMNTIWKDASYPTKEGSDAVAPNSPVFLTRACGHMGQANSKVIELVGITPDTPNPQGGEHLKNANGELLGYMIGAAVSPIRELIPGLTVEQVQEGLLKAQEQLFSYGLTSAMDIGNNVEVYNKVFVSLYESGELKLRIYGMISHTPATGETVEYLKSHPIDSGNCEPLYNNHLNLHCIKMSVDGSLDARSAAILEPYSDRKGHISDYCYIQEQVNEVVKVAHDAGYQIAIHCIGDGADNQIINACEAVIKTNPRDDHRLRIEYFQIVVPVDVDRVVSPGALSSMQTTHATPDIPVAEDRVGSERIKEAYTWRTILDKGSVIPNGSGAPVELVNPYHGIYVAVTRVNRLGEPRGGQHTEEAMTREEALRPFTNWPACAEFSEDIKGSLEVGKLVGFAVISRDLMIYLVEYIKDAQVPLTVSGGERVYREDASVPIVVWNGLIQSFSNKLVVEPGKIWVPPNDIMNGIGAEKRTESSSVLVTLDGKSVKLSVKTVDGVEYVAVRALFEGLGCNMTWYTSSNCVSIGWFE